MGKLFDIFGSSTGAKFYFRDFRNAYGHRPDQDPPRQQFNGYVNFVFNRDLYSFLFNDLNNDELLTNLSNQVKSADIPGVKFQTETLNEYNRKKIVNTGVEYDPVTIKVLDSVSNSWLITLMKYFSYHYMNPRNKQSDVNDRDIENPLYSRLGGSEIQNSTFGKGGNNNPAIFDSNYAGYNPNLTAHFFERIDYVLYHGGKAVQYSLINPVLTGFSHNQLDYSSSDVMEFDLTFEYETFTTHTRYNFDMGPDDLDRFEDASDLNSASHVFSANQRKSLAGDTTRSLELLLGNQSSPRVRTDQPGVETGIHGTETLYYNADGSWDAPTTYNEPNPTAPDSGKTLGGLFGEFLGDVADRALTAAINGGSVRDAAVDAVFDGIAGTIEYIGTERQDFTAAGTTELETTTADGFNTDTLRPSKPVIFEIAPGATEKPPQTPEG